MNKTTQQVSAFGERPASGSSVDIAEWDVENDAFWESKGKHIANRNL